MWNESQIESITGLSLGRRHKVRHVMTSSCESSLWIISLVSGPGEKGDSKRVVLERQKSLEIAACNACNHFNYLLLPFVWRRVKQQLRKHVLTQKSWGERKPESLFRSC